MEALKQGYDYLFFVDDDNPIPRDTLIKFLEDDKDVVCAPIPKRLPDADGAHALCAFYGHLHKDLRIYEPIKSFREEGYLHKIDACGMGCTLIKREVLEAVNKKYPNSPFQQGNLISFEEHDKVIDRSKGLKRTLSEDLEFSERVVDAGFEIWLDDRIRPLHLTNYGSVQWKPDVNTSSYWDEVWAREGTDTWRKYPLTFQKVASHISPEDTVLDVGCGVGVLLDVLKPLCREVAGLDISPKAIEILKSKGIEGKVGKLPTIDYPDKSFDVVVATETLEHLSEPELLVKEMMRVARKKVIVSVPDNVLGPDTEKEHKQLFTRDSFGELLSVFSDGHIEAFKDTFQNISLPTLLAVCKVGVS
uniref:Putative methyltransferase n=1 Tax=viral metagenome TaxID=1070528 RepID=A0A6M3L5V0_9ZZZZ